METKNTASTFTGPLPGQRGGDHLLAQTAQVRSLNPSPLPASVAIWRLASILSFS